MAKWGYKNLTMGQLNADIASDDVSVVLKSGQGALFPSDLPFRVIIWGKDFTQPYEDANAEIVEAVLSSGDTFIIERGKEFTSGYAWKEDDNFMLALTAEQLEEFDNKQNALSIANSNDINTGTDNAKYITPSGLAGSKYPQLDGANEMKVVDELPASPVATTLYFIKEEEE